MPTNAVLSMAKPVKKHTPSPQTKDEATKIAKAIQRPRQTKEQTRLIAQGIQKGIDQYKKQQKSKARDLDKKLKQVSRSASAPATEAEIQEIVHYKQHWLPWALLACSWIGFGAFYVYWS